MLFRALSAAALFAAPATAQSTDMRAKAERDLLEKVVEIPTVQFRGQVPRLVQLLSAEFRKSGITDIVVKDYEGRAGDKTQAMVVRWPAASPARQRPIILMAHMDVV